MGQIDDIMKKIDSKKILYSNGDNDECYTPEYWVRPILKYIYKYIAKLCWEMYRFDVKSITIWCPFDTEESNFVKIIRNNWYNVVCSHINNWQDFYTYEPENWDIMISNPPFTNKRWIFERALSFWKPFALLMSNTRLNDSAPKQLFKDRDLQLLMFDKRIEYNSDKKITFSSSYYCWNFLPKQIIMEFITKKQNENNKNIWACVQN